MDSFWRTPPVALSIMQGEQSDDLLLISTKLQVAARYTAAVAAAWTVSQQDSNNRRWGSFWPFGTTYQFGLSKRAIHVSANTAVPPQQVFAAAVTYTVRLPLKPSATLVPPAIAIAMLRQTVADDGDARGKSSDILVANSTRMITIAKALAEQTNCICRGIVRPWPKGRARRMCSPMCSMMRATPP